MEKEDTLSREGFTSMYRYRSTGDDPLGTQGRVTAQQLKAGEAKINAQNNQPKKGRKQKNPFAGLNKP